MTNDKRRTEDKERTHPKVSVLWASDYSSNLDTLWRVREEL